MCDFCQGSGIIEDEYEEWKLEAVKITPLPPVFLSGEPDARPYHAEKPYWALFLKYLDEDESRGEQGSFRIEYCPVCGRKMVPDPMLRPFKMYRELLDTPDNTLTDEEIHRKRNIENIPISVVTTILARRTELLNQMKPLERELDELADFLNGFWAMPFIIPEKKQDGETNCVTE